MHQLQKILLKRLQLENNQRYGSLARGYDFEDNIVFHLNKLIEGNLVSKSDGVYSITLNGIKEIARFEPFSLVDKGVKSFFVGFLVKDGNGNYLLKSHPNAKTNFYNLPSYKPGFGEKGYLSKGFERVTGLKLEENVFEFVSLHQKVIRSKSGEVIFDDAFAIFSVDISKVQREVMRLADNVGWFSVDEIKSLTRWPEVDMMILDKDFERYKVYEWESEYVL